MQVEASQDAISVACDELASSTTDLQRRELGGLLSRAGLVRVSQTPSGGWSEELSPSQRKRARHSDGIHASGNQSQHLSILEHDVLVPQFLGAFLCVLTADEFGEFGRFANWIREQEEVSPAAADPHRVDPEDEVAREIRFRLEPRAQASGFGALTDACEALRANVGVMQLRALLQAVAMPALLTIGDVLPPGIAQATQMNMLTDLAHLMQQLPPETLTALRDGVLAGVAQQPSATPQSVLMTLVQFDAEHFQLYNALSLLLTLPENVLLTFAPALPLIVQQPMQMLLLLQMLLLPPFDMLQFYNMFALHNLGEEDHLVDALPGLGFDVALVDEEAESDLGQASESSRSESGTLGGNLDHSDTMFEDVSLEETLNRGAIAAGSEIEAAMSAAASGSLTAEMSETKKETDPPVSGKLRAEVRSEKVTREPSADSGIESSAAAKSEAESAAVAAAVPVASASASAFGGPSAEWSGTPFEDIPRKNKPLYLEITDHPPERSVYKRNLKPNPMVVVHCQEGDDAVNSKYNQTGLLYVAALLIRCDTFVEEPRFVVGNRPERVSSSRAVTFRKLKVTTTSHQQQETLFCIRFELRRYADGTADEAIGAESDKENGYYTRVLQNQKIALSKARASKKAQAKAAAAKLAAGANQKVEALDTTGKNPPPRDLKYDVLDAIHSNPICVLSHSTQMKPAQQQAVPQVRECFPNCGPSEGGTRLAVLGANFVDSPAARVRFRADSDDKTDMQSASGGVEDAAHAHSPYLLEVMPIFHGPGTVLCHTPPHAPGETLVTVCNASQRWSETHATYEFGVPELVAAATGAGNHFSSDPRKGSDDGDGGVLSGSAVRDPRKRLISALHLACWRGDHVAVRNLLDRDDASIHAVDIRGFSPLHYAVCSVSAETVLVVLEKLRALCVSRADRVSAVGRPCVRYGMSSLGWACWVDALPIVQLLLEFIGDDVAVAGVFVLLADAVRCSRSQSSATPVMAALSALRKKKESRLTVAHSRPDQGPPRIVDACKRTQAGVSDGLNNREVQ